MFDTWQSDGVRWSAFPAEELRVVAKSGSRFPLATALASQPLARMALDGPMFGSGGQTEYLLLDVRSGVALRSRWPSRGATLGVTLSGEAFVAQGAALAAGARVAVQGYPALVLEGRNVATPERDTGREGRAALVLLTDGRFAFASARLGMHAFAEALRSSASAAVYTDGGSSLKHWIKGADRSAADAPSEPAVPAWLLAVDPLDLWLRPFRGGA